MFTMCCRLLKSMFLKVSTMSKMCFKRARVTPAVFVLVPVDVSIAESLLCTVTCKTFDTEYQGDF